MKNCLNCNSKVAESATFCQNCGHRVAVALVPCPNCAMHNRPNDTFCYSCGHSFKPKAFPTTEPKVKYKLDFSETAPLGDKIANYFLEALIKRIEEEYNTEKLKDYLEIYQDSNFSKKIAVRSDQLAEEAYTIHCKQHELVDQEIDKLLEENFDSLLDYFFTMHCEHLNDFQLSEAVLKYNNAKKGDVDIRQMMLDYLDLENEEEIYYTDFIKMPPKKLKNASTSFLFPRRKEKIYLICDQTVFGSCKEGFAMTESGIYWKAHFENSKKVLYQDLREIKRDKEWITINSYFFNVNPTLNFKLFKLLKKLKALN